MESMDTELKNAHTLSKRLHIYIKMPRVGERQHNAILHNSVLTTSKSWTARPRGPTLSENSRACLLKKRRAFAGTSYRVAPSAAPSATAFSKCLFRGRIHANAMVRAEQCVRGTQGNMTFTWRPTPARPGEALA